MKANCLGMAAAAIVAAAFLAVPSHAMHTQSMGPVAYWEGEQNGVPYVSGGVGLDERDAMKQILRDYDLKLEFATTNGEYVSEVKVDIRDAKGTPVLDAVTYGPWFFAKLPAGEYRVTVSYEGRTETGHFKIDKGVREHTFYW